MGQAVQMLLVPPGSKPPLPTGQLETEHISLASRRPDGAGKGRAPSVGI